MAKCKHSFGRKNTRYVTPFPRHMPPLTPKDAIAWRTAHPMCWERLEQLAKAEGIVSVRHTLALLRSTRHCPAEFRQAAQLAMLLSDMLAED